MFFLYWLIVRYKKMNERQLHNKSFFARILINVFHQIVITHALNKYTVQKYCFVGPDYLVFLLIIYFT